MIQVSEEISGSTPSSDPPTIHKEIRNIKAANRGPIIQKRKNVVKAANTTTRNPSMSTLYLFRLYQDWPRQCCRGLAFLIEQSIRKKLGERANRTRLGSGIPQDVIDSDEYSQPNHEDEQQPLKPNLLESLG